MKMKFSIKFMFIICLSFVFQGLIFSSQRIIKKPEPKVLFFHGTIFNKYEKELVEKTYNYLVEMFGEKNCEFYPQRKSFFSKSFPKEKKYINKFYQNYKQFFKPIIVGHERTNKISFSPRPEIDTYSFMNIKKIFQEYFEEYAKGSKDIIPIVVGFGSGADLIYFLEENWAGYFGNHVEFVVCINNESAINRSAQNKDVELIDPIVRQIHRMSRIRKCKEKSNQDYQAYNIIIERGDIEGDQALNIIRNHLNLIFFKNRD